MEAFTVLFLKKWHSLRKLQCLAGYQLLDKPLATAWSPTSKARFSRSAYAVGVIAKFPGQCTSIHAFEKLNQLGEGSKFTPLLE